MKRNSLIVLFFAIGILGIMSAQAWATEQAAAEGQGQEGLKARCVGDADCSRPGMIGVCQAPGEKTSRCLWQEMVKVPTTVIEPRACRSCQTSGVVDQLRALFPGLEVEYLKADDPKAKEIIKEMKITLLPAYILSKDAEREPGFVDFEKTVVLVNGKYYLKPEFSGVSYFLDRKEEKNKLDVFFVITNPGMYQTAKIAQEIRKDKKNNLALNVHFLGIEDAKTKNIVSPGSDREPAEEKVYACVEKYYPDQALDYFLDRLLNPAEIWIEDSLVARKCDAAKVKRCAQGREGEQLLKEKTRLSRELDIRYAPLFLMNNIEIFGVGEETTAREVIATVQGKPAGQ